MNKEQVFKIIETIVLALLTSCAIALGLTSCKAWRTISTTSTYTQVGDSSKVTTTISSKTIEEYTGVKKWPVQLFVKGKRGLCPFRKTSSIVTDLTSWGTRPMSVVCFMERLHVFDTFSYQVFLKGIPQRICRRNRSSSYLDACIQVNWGAITYRLRVSNRDSLFPFY